MDMAKCACSMDEELAPPEAVILASAYGTKCGMIWRLCGHRQAGRI